MYYKIILFLLSFIFAQDIITTKEFSIYKANDIKNINFSDIISDLNGIYSIELINIEDLQFNKTRKSAIQTCELQFSISSDHLSKETTVATVIPKKSLNSIEISLCDNQYNFKNKISISNDKANIKIHHDKYDHLSCSLIFWITGKFKSSNNTGHLNIDNDGILREWYDEDNLYIEYNFENGKKHGLQKRWYNNGQIDIMYYFNHGKLHGEQKRWHENGKIKFITNYYFDELNGLYKEWHSNGQLKEIKNYKNDILIDVLESYDNIGNPN